ncbi:MAG: response regulator transcription factor [Ignavibacteriae bacterium]|nr:response regulator transcription factor [Ignavibacteriota bacterium]
MEKNSQTTGTTERSLDLDGERLCVWIIEDDEWFARQLSQLIGLNEAFTCPFSFRSCEPALEKLQTENPPDIVLMDIGLPGMSGIEGIKRIRAMTPEVKTVMLTVFEDSNTIVQAISNGAAGYLLKGSSMETIVDMLKSIVYGGAPINPQIAKKILDVFAHTYSGNNDYGLTPREKEVLTHLVDGLQMKQIADRMFITFHTVDKHLRSIYTKLQVPSRSLAIAKALKENLL